MADDPSRSFLNSRRRAFNLMLRPALQLRLPLYLLLLTLVFIAVWGGHGLMAYGQLYDSALKTTSEPESLIRLVELQTGDFLISSLVILVTFALCVTALCVAQAHKMLGPAVAFRRHIEALKNGDYFQRVRLRKGDAFSDIADDLNELASILEKSEKPDR